MPRLARTHTDQTEPVPPIVFLLPQGLTVTGVNTWALSVVETLASQGVPCRALVHGGLDGHAPAANTRGSNIIQLDGLPNAGAPDAHHTWAHAYADAVLPLASASGQPAVVIPTRHEDCFAAATTLAREHPQNVHVLLWQQADSRYEDALIDHTEPIAPCLVGASAALCELIRTRQPRRAANVRAIPNAVRVPDRPPRRAPVRTSTGTRPVRLVYTGRIEHAQKRIGALPMLSRALTRLRVEHTLSVLGDGPAICELRDTCANLPSVDLPGACAPDTVRAHLAEADFFVLPSRYEGLSFSLLEAMALGCVPILAQMRSGAHEAVEHARTGLIADAHPETTPEDTAEALARCVCAALEHDLSALSANAHAHVRAHFSLDQHCAALVRTACDVARADPPAWPADRPLHLADARDARLAGAVELARAILNDSPVGTAALHGSGAHTARLLNALGSHASHIAHLFDDDPTAIGTTRMGFTVEPPRRAASLGVRTVIISTDLYEDEVWARRDIYESQGVRVRRLYAACDADAPVTT